MLTALLLALFLGLLILLLLIIFLGPSLVKGDVGKSCTVDSDCLHSLMCEYQNGSGVCKVRLDGPCTSINDCSAAATTCFHGRCIGTPLGNVGDPAPCRSGLTSEFNMCRVPTGGVCNGNGDCLENLVCSPEGVCVSPQSLRAQLTLPPPLKEPSYPVNIMKIPLQHPLEEERIRREKEQQVLEGEETTLVVMDAFQKNYKEITPIYYNVNSALLFDRYLILTTKQGEVRVYDNETEVFVPILIRDRLVSVALVNGYITGINTEGDVVQFRNKVVHSDNTIEWTSTPLHLRARAIASSPDGHYMALLVGDDCHIYNENLQIEKTLHLSEQAKDVILGYNLKNVIIVTEKGLQVNDERYLQARGGCFTSDGRFAMVPLSADHIVKSYIFNDVKYHIVKRSQLHRLLESSEK